MYSCVFWVRGSGLFMSGRSSSFAVLMQLSYMDLSRHRKSAHNRFIPVLEPIRVALLVIHPVLHKEQGNFRAEGHLFQLLPDCQVQQVERAYIVPWLERIRRAQLKNTQIVFTNLCFQIRKKKVKDIRRRPLAPQEEGHSCTKFARQTCHRGRDLPQLSS